MFRTTCLTLWLSIAGATTACSDGGPSTNSVVAPVATRIDVSPPNAALIVGSNVQLSATVYDQNNQTMSSAVSWTSSAVAVATVSNTGSVLGVTAGGAVITAATGGASGTASVSVTAPNRTIRRVQVAPGADTILVGETVTLTATAYDAQDVPVAGHTVSFGSSNATVATVTQTGVVTGAAPGTVTITVTIDGVSGTGTVTVKSAPASAVQTVTVSPDPVSLLVGGTATLSAVPTDAQGNLVPGKTPAWSSASTAVVTVSTSGVVTAVATGTSVVTATIEGVVGQTTVSVVALPQGNVIAIDPGQTFQTISGWDGTAGLGETDCNQTAYNLYKGPVMTRLVNELGITRLRIPLRSGAESPVDYFKQFQSGQITYAQWEPTWFMPVNDNGNPNVVNPSGFQWSFLDFKIDQIVTPMMQLMQARGEKLYVILNYIDFKKGQAKTFVHMKQPAEYTEFVVAAFEHIRQKYGWTPDAFEVLLEPQNSGATNVTVTGADLGAVTAAVGPALAAAGFHPDFVVPSDASMAGSITYYDDMIKTPGVLPYLTELSYHRYQGVSLANLQTIAQRAQRDHLRTAMTEFNQATFDTLIEDLTVGNNAGWEQFSLAYCGKITNPAALGIYYQVNQSVPTNPIVTMTSNARDFRQIFAYVRPGAVRIGATSGNASVLQPVAFRNATGKYVIVVRTQAGAAFSLTGVPSGTYGLNFNSQTQNGVNLSDVVAGPGGVLSAATPTKGVITIYQR